MVLTNNIIKCPPYRLHNIINQNSVICLITQVAFSIVEWCFNGKVSGKTSKYHGFILLYIAPPGAFPSTAFLQKCLSLPIYIDMISLFLKTESKAVHKATYERKGWV